MEVLKMLFDDTSSKKDIFDTDKDPNYVMEELSNESVG